MKKKTDEHPHYFEKCDGSWKCACGVQRDKHGKPKAEKRRPTLRAI